MVEKALEAILRVEKSNILLLLEKIMVYKQYTKEDIKTLMKELVFNNPYADITFKPKNIEFTDLDFDDIPQNSFVAGQYVPSTRTLQFSNKFIEVLMENGLNLEMLCHLLSGLGHELTHCGQFSVLEILINNPKTTMDIPDEIRDVVEEQETFRITSKTAKYINKITQMLVGKSLGLADSSSPITINDILMHGSYYNSAMEVDARDGGASFAKSTLIAIGLEAAETNSPLAKDVLDVFVLILPTLLNAHTSGLESQAAFVALKDIVNEIDIKQLINLEEHLESDLSSFSINRADYPSLVRALKFCYDVKLNRLSINELIKHSKNSTKCNLPLYQAEVHDKIARLITTHASQNLPATLDYVNSVMEESEKKHTPIISDSLARLVGSVADPKTLCQYMYKTAHLGWGRCFNQIAGGFTKARLNVNKNDAMLSHMLLIKLNQEATNFKAKVSELLASGNKQAVAKYMAVFSERAKSILHMFDYDLLNTQQKEMVENIQYILDELSGIVMGPIFAPAYDPEELNAFLKRKR